MGRGFLEAVCRDATAVEPASRGFHRPDETRLDLESKGEVVGT